MANLIDPQFVGAQLFTVRDWMRTAEDLHCTLDKIASMGYQSVQLSAVDAMNGDRPQAPASKVREWLDSFELKCSATHRPWDSLLRNYDFELDFHQELECTYAAIGSLPSEVMRTPLKLQEFLDQFSDLAKKYKEDGIRLGIHNHDWDAAVLLENIPYMKAQWEMDVFWLNEADLDIPTSFFLCRGHLDVIHLKDKPSQSDFDETQCRFAAIGEGTICWPEIIPAALEAGTTCFLVEQDVCPRDPFDCLRSSWNYLCT